MPSQNVIKKEDKNATTKHFQIFKEQHRNFEPEIKKYQVFLVCTVFLLKFFNILDSV